MITVRFEIDYATKRTIRFKEKVEREGDKKIGVIYLQKSAFDGKPPERIRVMVEPEPE